MKEFKAGDWVYFPMRTHRVAQLNSDDENLIYTLKIDNTTFTLSGLLTEGHKNQSIFHATEENRQLLNKLYGVEFEKPPLRGSELTKKLLESGWDCVPCWVSKVSDENARHNKSSKIISFFIENDNYPFKFCIGSTGLAYAVPFDPRTGEELTEEVLDEI